MGVCVGGSRLTSWKSEVQNEPGSPQCPVKGSVTVCNDHDLDMEPGNLHDECGHGECGAGVREVKTLDVPGPAASSSGLPESPGSL